MVGSRRMQDPVTGARNSILLLALDLADARREHEEAKSDPSRNVGTGQRLYAAQQNLEKVLDQLRRTHPAILQDLRAKCHTP